MIFQTIGWLVFAAWCATGSAVAGLLLALTWRNIRPIAWVALALLSAFVPGLAWALMNNPWGQ